MKVRIINATTIFVISLALGGCTPKPKRLIRIQEDGLYGYIDTIGNVIIEPQYKYAGDFTEDNTALIISKVNTNVSEDTVVIEYGYIDSSNSLVVDTANILRISTHDMKKWGFQYSTKEFVQKFDNNDLDFNASFLRELYTSQRMYPYMDEEAACIIYKSIDGDTTINSSIKNIQTFSVNVEPDNDFIYMRKDTSFVREGIVNKSGDFIWETNHEQSTNSNSHNNYLYWISVILVGLFLLSFTALTLLIIIYKISLKREDKRESRNKSIKDGAIPNTGKDKSHQNYVKNKEKNKKTAVESCTQLQETQNSPKNKIEENTSRIDNHDKNPKAKKSDFLSKKTKEDPINLNVDIYKKNEFPKQQLFYVSYTGKNLPRPTEGYYFDLKVPAFKALIYPYRRSKIERRGYMEASFETKLKTELVDLINYEVLGDVSIHTKEGTHPYEPDIAIVEKTSKYGIRIDIEIDEPYGGIDAKPIHYIGCGDEHRDAILCNYGWMVIRFSEKQVYTEPLNCVSLVRNIISSIDNTIIKKELIYPHKDKHWTLTTAQELAIAHYREEYLKHKFGILPKESILNSDVALTELEQLAAKIIPPLEYRGIRCRNLDNSETNFDLDKYISFEPKEHIYMYKGQTELTPVSSIISKFFRPFDTISMSEHKAYKERRNQREIIEEWDAKGKESRDVGTFMHEQIEAFLNGNPTSTVTRFTYSGEFVNIDKKVSISTEIIYFKKFLSENHILPFRTEWYIYDLAHKIAGTIDLLCRNGEEFDIYDWKRSQKVSPNETIWNYGINGLGNVPDTNFYHYALQQNIYKYILEKNYGIKIKTMYLVVLHYANDGYKKFQIPDMRKEINIIMSQQ